MTKDYKGQVRVKNDSSGSTSKVIHVEGKASSPQEFKAKIEAQYATTFLGWHQSPIESR